MKKNETNSMYVFQFYHFFVENFPRNLIQYLFQLKARQHNENLVRKINNEQTSTAYSYLVNSHPYLKSNELYDLWHRTKQAALSQVLFCFYSFLIYLFLKMEIQKKNDQ